MLIKLYYCNFLQYILSSGKDSMVKLWELSTVRSLIAYTGAGATGKQEFTTQAVFNYTEEYVIYPDEATVSLCAWDARTAQRQNLLSLGNNCFILNLILFQNCLRITLLFFVVI